MLLEYKFPYFQSWELPSNCSFSRFKMNGRHVLLLRLPSPCLYFPCCAQDKGAQQHSSVLAVPVEAPGVMQGLCLFPPVAISKDLH